MAETHRKDLHDLIGSLVAGPHAFSFFQAVRILECAAAGRHPRVGLSRDPTDDFVRFGQHVELVHLATDIRSVTPAGDPGNPIYRLKACFTGLAGPFGPMPEWLTETLVHLAHGIPDETLFPPGPQGGGLYATAAVKDEGMAEFLDLFHHRMFSFLYRAWSSGNMAVAFDRAALAEGKQHESDAPRFGHFIGSTFGTGSDALFDHPVLPSFARLAFAGHLSCQTRHAEGLEAILRVFFGVPAEIHQLVGHWMEIPLESRCRLGESASTGTLGGSVFVGRRMWDHQQKFRLRLGPMNLARLKGFLPGGNDHARLGAWLDFYTSRRWTCDIQIVLEREHVPCAVLGQAGELGRTCWLKSRPFLTDAEDLVLQHAN
jgi:type VI secretion system protein ImpH